MMNISPLHYELTPEDPFSHQFHVTLTIDNPDPDGQVISLPNWIPGSYLIRDFSKHLLDLTAETRSGRQLSIEPKSSSEWVLEPTTETVWVEYRIYAWDLSVRSAHFDQTHAFCNGTSVFLSVQGKTKVPHKVTLNATDFTDEHHWRVATSLPRIDVNAEGFGEYQAESYQDLIEYPIEMGSFLELSFDAVGIPHRIAITGRFSHEKLDRERLLHDLQRICETELAMFGSPYPFQEYLFQVTVVENGYGGLEHTNSTALICAREHLPFQAGTDPKRYMEFLELCSHEYFHSWNVKRIKPRVFLESDLSKPAYTRQLWWFEGVTSYYDGLFLHRAGLITEDEYLNNLAQEMTRVYRMPGRFRQSVAESSFHAWTKFYQQDENAPNAIISYYTKGSLIALALDLIIRQATQNTKCLDDVVLRLWEQKGEPNVGLEEGEIEQICEDISGLDLRSFFDRYLYDTNDLPFEEMFAPFGMGFSLRAATSLSDKGGKTDSDESLLTLGANVIDTEHQTVKVTHVWNYMTAERAGLAAGDEIVALNAFKVSNTKSLEQWLRTYSVGESVSCHFFRRDELFQSTLYFEQSVKDRVVLSRESDQTQLRWPLK